MNGTVILKRKEELRLLKGHLWIFSNEIFSIDGSPENGDLVNVYDSRNNLLGCGFFNKNSLIAVRMISAEPVDNMYSLIKGRLHSAFSYRKSVYPLRNSFRMVFSESDFLPGLIIDKFNDTYVIQINSFGMEKHIEPVAEILKTEYGAKNIFTKNEANFRTMEGLPVEDFLLFGEKGEEVIDDGKLKYKIDFNNSQKTGLFFDQSDNRYFIEMLSEGKNVLDGFCNSGGFGLHALSGNAASVDFVDSSESEIKAVENNYQLNQFETDSNLIQSDMFEFLQDKTDSDKRYDLVMIDPPAFIKGKKNLHTGIKGYEKLNRLALKIVEKGGFFVTSSCSHHLTRDLFLDIIINSAQKSGRSIIKVYENGASLDHPVHPAMPETSYLKFFVFRVVD
ncbi:MAG TPA: class I SAM-dependent rRNA methyltransferase [Ignavibacteriaceae bacterium]|jgi:23S rRNA (cytosine1962-C5)-methyltransferase|nr:class I SAM-dependent rRNA methyltransferase [Ignavibacteriaceae bacterium]